MHFFKVHAGDFGDGEASFSSDVFRLPIPGKLFAQVKVPKEQVAGVEVATEESVKRLAGAVGWGLVGGALLGPVGLLAGLLAGGRGKKVVFIVRFKDGRKLLGSADGKDFTAIQAAAF